MKPLFKNGNRNSMSNYRPTAQLISFSKVLQEVTYERMCQRINNTNIISEEHCGFWRNSSTEKAAHKSINDILQAINSTLSVDGIFCDIQRAFYFMNHHILLSTLQFYCTVGTATALTMSYLKDRYQWVLINNISSLSGRINTAVPHGSILNYNPYVCVKFVYQ